MLTSVRVSPTPAAAAVQPQEVAAQAWLAI
jgi:hypothetical protein